MSQEAESSPNSENIQNIQRQVARKVRIKDIVGGEYVKEEGWKPNYIVSRGVKFSRAQLLGFVLENSSKDNSHETVIDDGTGKISLRFFKDNIGKGSIRVGKLVRVIGRPREYGGERYIVPEIIKEVDDDRWIKVHKYETGTAEPDDVGGGGEAKSEEIIEEKVSEKPLLITEVYEKIRAMDKGMGVDVGDLIKEYPEEDVEEMIRSLVERGEIFENKKGSVKVLE